MLLGEYSVLDGGYSVSFPTKKSMSAQFEEKPGNGIEIHSHFWDQPKKFSFHTHSKNQNHCMVIDTLQWIFDHSKRPLPSGELRLDSRKLLKDGLGSSSALRLSLLQLFDSYIPMSTSNVISHVAYHLQKKSQNRASGYDIATQWHKKPIIFQNKNDRSQMNLNSNSLWAPEVSSIVKKYPEFSSYINKNFSILTGGGGVKTNSIMSSTMSILNDSDRLAKELKLLNSECFENFLLLLSELKKESKTLKSAELKFLKSLQSLRGFFRDFSTFPREVFDILCTQNGFDKTWTVKPCGAGGKDALIVFSTLGIDCRVIEDGVRPLKELGWNLEKEPFLIDNHTNEMNAYESE